MPRKTNKALLAAALCLAAISCDNDRGGDVVLSTRVKDGFYCVEAIFEEGVTYSTSIVARCDPGAVPGSCLALDIMLTSPQGDKYIDRVDFPLQTPYGRPIADLNLPYRGGVRMEGEKAGRWEIAIRPVDSLWDAAICSLGFFYEGN